VALIFFPFSLSPSMKKVTQKLVQVGRVCFVAFGPEQGKLCTIVDIVDINRVCKHNRLCGAFTADTRF